MASFKFPYAEEFYYKPGTEEPSRIFRPKIPIRMKYKNNFNKWPISCVLDSGADYNLFPASWGISVGIAIKKGQGLIMYGIGGKEIKAYRHNISLFVNHYSFDTTACFSLDQQVPLLGRNDFFIHFDKVILEQKKLLVELIY